MLGHLWAQIDPFQWRETNAISLTRLSFCALCGTCGCPPDDEIRAALQASKQDSSVLHEHDVAWLGQMQILGGHPLPSQSALKHPVHAVFTTGPLEIIDGTMRFRGNPIDFEDANNFEIHEDPRGPYLHFKPNHFLQMFRPTTAPGTPLYLRVHTRCYEILTRVVKAGAGLAATRNLFDDRYSVSITPGMFDRIKTHYLFMQKTICGVKFGEPIPPRIQTVTQATKSVLYDPIPTGHPSRVNMTGPSMLLLRPGQRTKVASDSFTKLPVEIILDIVENLDIMEIIYLSLASAAAARSLNNLGFWSQRIKKNMPWLWDFDGDEILQYYHCRDGDTIDWMGLYLDLGMRSTPGSKSPDPALSNRQRIWLLCDGIWRFGQDSSSK